MLAIYSFCGILNLETSGRINQIDRDSKVDHLHGLTLGQYFSLPNSLFVFPLGLVEIKKLLLVLDDSRPDLMNGPGSEDNHAEEAIVFDIFHSEPQSVFLLNQVERSRIVNDMKIHICEFMFLVLDMVGPIPL